MQAIQNTFLLHGFRQLYNEYTNPAKGNNTANA